ncbi:MAG: hydroxyacid dehydrogenase [Clostridia bacterium]|nr:hydroxyacid dehydrogenase [Clostridia bacterium]
MAKIKAALSATILEPYMSQVQEALDITPVGLALGHRPTEDELIEQCMGHEVVYISSEPVTRKALEAWKASGLKLLGCGRGTPVNVDWRAAHELGIPLVYTPGRNAESVAEYVFGLVLSLLRGITRNYHCIKNGGYLADPVDDVIRAAEESKQTDVVWRFPDGRTPMREFGGGYDLYDHTISIIGFGAIGSRVARIAHGFGMEVIAYDPYCPAEVMEKAGVESVSLDAALSRGDIVSIHLPVNDQTRGIVDKTWFDRMKPEALFINSARASVVNQRDMIEALEQKKIAGAAVDVMWVEPCPANHPFFSMENVLVTTHLAGMSHDVEKWQSSMIADELLRYARGEAPQLVWKRTE